MRGEGEWGNERRKGESHTMLEEQHRMFENDINEQQTDHGSGKRGREKRSKGKEGE